MSHPLQKAHRLLRYRGNWCYTSWCLWMTEGVRVPINTWYILRGWWQHPRPAFGEKQNHHSFPTLECGLFMFQATTIVFIICPIQLPSLTPVPSFHVYKCLILLSSICLLALSCQNYSSVVPGVFFVTTGDLFYAFWHYNCVFYIVRLWISISFLWIFYLYGVALGSLTFLCPRGTEWPFPSFENVYNICLFPTGMLYSPWVIQYVY